MAESSDPHMEPHDVPPTPPIDVTGSSPVDRDISGLTPPVPEAAFPIVGIGASAGGLDAVTQLLRALPVEPGLALILIQHLDPTHESVLAELLSRVTRISVQQIRDGTPVAPNQVYVAPPQADVIITNRILNLIPRSMPRGLHMPIDRFFRSPAEDQGAHAIGIVLSGQARMGRWGYKTSKSTAASPLSKTSRRRASRACRTVP